MAQGREDTTGIPYRGTGTSPRGYLIPPKIFIIMVNTIVCQWVVLLAYNESGPDGFGYTVEEKADLFYSYDGLIYFTNQV